MVTQLLKRPTGEQVCYNIVTEVEIEIYIGKKMWIRTLNLFHLSLICINEANFDTFLITAYQPPSPPLPAAKGKGGFRKHLMHSYQFCPEHNSKSVEQFSSNFIHWRCTFGEVQCTSAITLSWLLFELFPFIRFIFLTRSSVALIHLEQGLFIEPY
jgi:hypothetical protein